MGVSIADSRATFSAVAHVLLRRQAPGAVPVATPGVVHAPGVEILLLRRANTGFMDGYYGLPGGHVDAGELPSAAAQRECAEEAGVQVQDLEPLAVLPFRSAAGSASRSGNRIHTGFNFLFQATQWQGQAHIAEPDHCDVLCWAPPHALPQPYPDWLDAVVHLRPQVGWYAEMDYLTRPA